MQYLEKSLTYWMGYVVSNPLKVIFSTLFICGLCLIGMANFELDANPRAYLGQDLPLIKHLTDLEAEYVVDTNLFFMLKAENGSLFSIEGLSATKFLTDAAWHIPYAKRVDSITNFQYTYAEGDELIVEDLVSDTSDLSASEIERIRRITLSDPRLLNFLISPDGKAAGVNVLVDSELGNRVQDAEISAYIEQIKQELSIRYPGVSLYEAGFSNLGYHWIGAAMRDGKYIFSTSFIVMVLGLIYFFRNLRAMIAVMLTGVLSSATGLGILGMLGLVLNPATALSILMILILGIADGIHITKSVRRLLSEGLQTKEAIKQSVVVNFLPVALTSITTAIGFLSFNFAEFAGVRLMGNYVAAGIMLAFALSISLLPAMLCFCGLIAEKKPTNGPMHERLTWFVVKFRKPLLISLMPAIIFGLYAINLMHFDERFTRYLDDEYILTQHIDRIQEDLTGMSGLIYNFSSGEEGGVSDPEFLARVEAFKEWLLLDPNVRHVSSITDTLKQLNKNLNSDQKAFYRLPESKDLAAQYLLLYELSLPYGLELTNQINLDMSATRVVVTINDIDIKQTKDLMERSKQWLEENAPGFDTFPNSNAVACVLGADQTIRTMMFGGVGALVIIGVMLLFTFRSSYAGAICVLSVVAPIIVTWGLWGAFVRDLGVAGGLAICMVIGMSVDFSIHFVSKFIHARQQLHKTTEDSVSYAFRLVLSPILTSMLVIGTGFLILSFSQFEYNHVMGSLTAICVFFAALSSLLLVPSILPKQETF